MPQGHLTGSRIRDHRLDRGISQTDLALKAGISPSYLNLIEHNRRRIGGKLLNNIARALSLDAALLSEATEPALLEALGLAAAMLPETRAEVPKAAEFSARFPGWAATVAAQARRIAELDDRVAALSDRLAHDPQLDRSLHEVISVVTSIRSTASILVADEGLDPDWRNRFHHNLHDDSRRLAEASQGLAAYLEAPRSDARARLSPGEELDRFCEEVARTPGVFEEVGEAVLERIRDPGARAMAARWLAERRAEARALPIERLATAADRLGHDPAVLAADLGLGLLLVMRRMAALPEGPAHPPVGLVVCDAAGAIIEMKPAGAFALSRGAPACPLWPLFEALSSPGRPVQAVVELPGGAAPRMTCYAFAHPVAPLSFAEGQRHQALMLVLTDAQTGPARPVGRSCRICPRDACPARREPSILPGVTPERRRPV